MTTFRSRRLEAVFGSPIGSGMPYAAIASLASDRVSETTDLEYKKEHYGSSDGEKRKLSGDIAAMANAAGGVILLGVEEDEHAAAKKLVHVDLGDEEIRRIRSIAAGGISPLPTFDVFPVANPADPNKGIIVIAIPPSPMRPHAVLVNEGLRFPQRHGAGITYLTEAQVANAYRQRSRRIDEGAMALQRLETNLLEQFRSYTCGRLVVTLVPDVPGDFPLDTAAFRAFRGQLGSISPGILDNSWYWARHRVAGGRLIARDGDDSGPSYLMCELYRDGSGSFATTVGLDEERNAGLNDGNRMIYMLDERVIDSIWSGLLFLGRHARDRAGVGGNTAIRVTIPSADLPKQLFHVRHGFRDPFGHVTVGSATAEGLFDLDDLAEPGPDLVAATYQLATELFQEFGRPEAVQMTPDGVVRTRYWSPQVYGPRLIEWAKQHGIETTEETVEGG